MINQRARYRPSHRHLVSSSHLVIVVVSSAAFPQRAPFCLLVATCSCFPRPAVVGLVLSSARCLVPLVVSSSVPSFVLFSVHPSSHPVGSFHPSSLAALCAVSFCSSLVVSSRSVLRPVPRFVSHSSARPRSPFHRHGRRGVFFSHLIAGGQASKGAGRRRAGDGLGQSGESEGRGIHAMGRWQASRRERS